MSTSFPGFFVLALALVGCAGGVSIQQSELDFSAPEAPNAWVIADARAYSAQTPPEQRVLYVAPDAELMPFMQGAIDRLARLGFNVAISDDGLPIYFDADVPEGAQGEAVYKHWCFYGQCTAAQSYIRISPVAFDFPEGFVENCIIHELGHVISGWGACAEHLPMADGMHLVKGNLISNGNNDYETFVLTEDDLRLLQSCVF